jgi:hypothetical protein
MVHMNLFLHGGCIPEHKHNKARDAPSKLSMVERVQETMSVSQNSGASRENCTSNSVVMSGSFEFGRSRTPMFSMA